MAAAPYLAALALVAAGCGGDDAASERTPAQTARAWVAAVNEGDWAGACALSVPAAPGCERMLRDGFGGERPVRIEEHPKPGDAHPAFAISTAASRSERAGRDRGWTAYAPAEFAIERRDDEWRVHFEVQVIH